MKDEERPKAGGPAVSKGFKGLYDLEACFPEVEEFFEFENENIVNIKQRCLVALDANVLLLPYKMDSLSLTSIGKIYLRLSTEKRLLLPAQAAREYLRLRPSKIAEISSYLRKEANALAKPVSKKIGFLEEDNLFKDVVATAKEIKGLQKRLRGQLEATIKNLVETDADPVMKLYRSVFKNCISDFDFQSGGGREAFDADMKQRYANKRPPGYKDSGKEDGGYGDLLIWRTLIQHCALNNRDLIFVTNEEKPDWFVSMGEGKFQPRPELVDEFRRECGGKSLHLVSLSSLLALYDADDNTVQTVRTFELKTEIENSSLHKPRSYGFLKREILAKESELRQWEASLAGIPEFDANISPSLPWNRARYSAYANISTISTDLSKSREELRLYDDDNPS